MRIIVKLIIGALIFLGLGYLGILLDSMIVNAIVDAIPKSHAEWKDLINIICWIVIIIFTFGPIFGISLVVSSFITQVLIHKDNNHL